MEAFERDQRKMVERKNKKEFFSSANIGGEFAKNDKVAAIGETFPNSATASEISTSPKASPLKRDRRSKKRSLTSRLLEFGSPNVSP